jgi:hypothetical protein
MGLETNARTACVPDYPFIHPTCQIYNRKGAADLIPDGRARRETYDSTTLLSTTQPQEPWKAPVIVDKPTDKRILTT